MPDPWSDLTPAQRQQFREAQAEAKVARAARKQRLADVRPGQVWADLYPVRAGRTLRVESIEGSKAVCVVLTNSDRVQKALDTAPGEPGYTWETDRRGKTTRISLRRFRPGSAGYRLIAGSPAPAGEGQ